MVKKNSKRSRMPRGFLFCVGSDAGVVRGVHRIGGGNRPAGA